jgi:hypothetical protein
VLSPYKSSNFTNKSIAMQRNLIILISILLLIQLIRIDTTPKASDNSRDFLVQSSADENISARIKAACYDCHSHEMSMRRSHKPG